MSAIVHLTGWPEHTSACWTDDQDALTTGNPDDVTCFLCAEIAGIDLEEVDQ